MDYIMLETLYKMINIISMLVCLGCCVDVVKKKPSVNQKYLMMVCIAGFVTTVGNAMEVVAFTQEGALSAVKISYLGKCYIMVFGLLFVGNYSHVKIPKWLISFHGISNTLILWAIMSCQKHTWFYRNISSEVRSNGRIALILESGPLYYMWLALFMVSIIIYVVIAANNMSDKSEMVQSRLKLLFGAAVIPFTCALFFVVIKPRNFDPTSLVVMMSELCIFIAVIKYGLLDTVEIAQESFLEKNKDGIILIDGEKKNIIYANMTAKNIFFEQSGMNAEEVINWIYNDSSKDENVLELNGKHYEVRISEIKQSEQGQIVQGYMVWIFDMTFIDEYTNEMIRLKEEAEQANMAKTNFLAHMSHEIRTPMNSIVGYAELAMHGKDESLVRGYLKHIKTSAHTLLRLINEMLDISKIEAGKMEMVNVNYSFNKLINEIRYMMEAQAGKNAIAFLVDTDDDIPDRLYGDRMKIQEIITNLINNGLKYTKAGRVSLRTKFMDYDADKNMVKLQFEIEDTGIGIKVEDYSKVFGKFEQFDKKENYSIEGTGLGLAIVKNFVDMMGGEISFTSEYGKGTKFIVNLWQELGKVEDVIADESIATVPEVIVEPVITVEAPSQKDNSNTSTNDNSAGFVELKSGKILVVDDNELNCDVAQGILELLGMEVEITYSGIDCLKMLEEGKKYDLIFMDHMMPELDGVETLERIRAMGGEFEKLPVVLLTANAIAGIKEQMIDKGFDDYLSKPIDVDALQHVLGRFLGK